MSGPAPNGPAPSGPAPGAPDGADGPPVVARDGDVVRVRLARPRQHNRIDPDDIAVLQGAFDAVRADASVRTLILTGSGARTFCSGYTLQAVATGLDERFERMLDALEALPVPTVCAIAGGVYGGGTDLALCCDLRIGTPAARMFMPAARFGLHYYPGGLRRYVARLGMTAARKLLLTATTIHADEMLRIGFLTDCVPAGELDATVERYVAEIAACEPRAVALMKASLDAIGRGAPDWDAMRADHERTLRSDALRSRLATRLRRG